MKQEEAQAPRIYKLSDLTEAKRSEIENVINTNPQFQRPNKDFDSNGLRFSVEYLGAIGGAIAFMPLEYIAEYVDIITKDAVDKNETDFINITNEEFSKEYGPDDFVKWNATAIGNMAYVTLFSKVETLQKLGVILLQKYADWYFAAIMNELASQAQDKKNVN